MNKANEFRRTLLKGALGGAVAQGWPNLAFAQTPIRIRLEWQQFKQTSHYTPFLNAIAAMRRNTNPMDRRSLQYWANVHQNHCPHGTPYFVSWHRGYLFFFEQELRNLSGDPNLTLPYWDYFSYSTLPAEFTDPAASNPLYLPRLSANVYNALDLAPFASTVHNFQRGTTNSFEPKLESAPHNPVHDLIGGIMSTMRSPLDPVFYLHHANIDRMTHAWALPDGKGIPYSAFPYSATNSDIYWAGNNVYSSELTIERYLTLIPTWLGYNYASNHVPTALPPLAVTAQAGKTLLPSSPRLPPNERPKDKSHTPVPGRPISATRRSLGGAALLGFDEQSVSIRLKLNKNDADKVAGVIGSRRDRPGKGDDETLGAVKIVIDKATVSNLGRQGGYFYALYLNMPPVIDSRADRERAFLGTLGAFQIAGAAHHGPARLEFDITDLLAQQNLTDYSELSFSWVRVNGDRPPAGRAIHVNELRIELAYEAPAVQPPPIIKPAGWYR